jgi:hypothetical protein
MSVLGNQTNIRDNTYLFIQDTLNVTFQSTINILNGTINTSQINLDAIQMDCGYVGPTSTATLFLNGTPVASTSSFTSSITQWSQYNAIAPVTYGAGGGVLNFTNVNALSNVSTATMNSGTSVANTYTGSTLTISTINGAPYPTPTTPSLLGATTTALNGLTTINIDMSSLPTGYYLVYCLMASGTPSEVMDSTAMIRLSGGNSGGGSYHQPVISGVSNSNNYISIQQQQSAGAVTQVFVQTNLFAGTSIQTGCYRIY